MVPRLPVPPGVHIHAACRTSVVHRFYPCSTGASNRMKINDANIGNDQSLFLIAGPDSLETPALALDIAGHMTELCRELNVPYVFKGSFDKANRSSHASYRGPGLEAGLDTLTRVQRDIGIPVTTDVHVTEQITPVAAVVDLLQTPAFLCRQTDFIQAVAARAR